MVTNFDAVSLQRKAESQVSEVQFKNFDMFLTHSHLCIPLLGVLDTEQWSCTFVVSDFSSQLHFSVTAFLVVKRVKSN